jgi:hypothetical protein
MPFDFETYVWREGSFEPSGGNTSPWAYDLGVTQGRIQPQNFPVPDGAYVLCIGSDLLQSPSFKLAIGEKFSFEQVIDLTGIDLIGARIRIRQPQDAPGQRELQGTPEDIVLYSAAEVLIQAPDVYGQVGGVMLAPSANFTVADLGQEIEITNPAMGSNVGKATIIGLVPPATPGAPITTALLDRNLVDEGPTTGMSVLKLGARFVARVYVEDLLRVETGEVLGRYRDRLDIRAHVSKLQSQHSIKFEFAFVDERDVP